MAPQLVQRSDVQQKFHERDASVIDSTVKQAVQFQCSQPCNCETAIQNSESPKASCAMYSVMWGREGALELEVGNSGKAAWEERYMSSRFQLCSKGRLHVRVLAGAVLVFGCERKNSSKCKPGVCHTVALPFTLKSILRQKKYYGNSNISPCKNIIFKNPLKENKILQDIITL